MPVRIRKVKGGYRVTDGGRITAKRTSRVKADAQARLLRSRAGKRRRGLFG
jgi:hypothetical protein